MFDRLFVLDATIVRPTRSDLCRLEMSPPESTGHETGGPDGQWSAPYPCRVHLMRVS